MEPTTTKSADPIEFLHAWSVDPGDAPDGIDEPSPYVHMTDPEEDIALMTNSNEVVIKKKTIRILYTYPLGTVGPTEEEDKLGGWIFTATARCDAFTRAELARAISARYRQIYAEEEADASKPPHNVPGMLNRAESDGRYGIWGHCLSDLLLHGVSYDEDDDIYHLHIDS